MATQRLDLALNLINGVSGNANKIKSDLAQINIQAKQLQASLGMKGLDKKFAGTYFKGMIKDIRTANGELKQSTKGEQLRASAIAFGGIIRDAIEGAAKTLINAARSVVEIVGDAEQTELGLKYQAGAAREYVKLDVGAYSKNTGMGTEDIKKQLIPLLNAGFSDSQARQVREASSDLSVMLGHGTKETDEFVETFKKINLREGLQARQLMRMNIQEKTFYDLLGKNTGTTADVAKKMAAKGKLDPTAITNTLLQLVANKEGGRTGNATKEYAESFDGRIEKLKALPQEFLSAMKDNPAWKELSKTLGGLYDQLSPKSAKGQAIMSAAGNAFTALSQAAIKALTPENIDKWTASLLKALNAVGYILDNLGDITGVVTGTIGFFLDLAAAVTWLATPLGGVANLFRDIGIIMAAVKISGWISALVDILPALGTSLGALSVGAGAALAPLLAVAAALGAVYLAYTQIKKTIDELGGWDAVKGDIRNIGSKVATSNNDVNANSPAWKVQKALANPDQYNYMGTGNEAMRTKFSDLSDEKRARFASDPRLNAGAISSQGAKNSVTVSAPINVTVEGGMSSDDNHTGQQVGQTVGDHVSRQVNQSLNEIGGN